MTDNAPRFLVVDGYPKEDRENLAGCGMTLAGDLYAKMLTRLCPGARCDIIFPSDSNSTLLAGLKEYDGIAWTGCSLTIHDQSDKRVARHLELARTAYNAGVPQYGSCWGIQIAVVAAGGTVAAHPHGREMGIGRKITLTEAGRGHPMFADKPSAFDGFVSHFDEVTHLPFGSEVLAGNAYTRVQAVSIYHGKGTFWGLQYHPEYDIREMARLIYCRRASLTNEGFFTSEADALTMVAGYEGLHTDPNNKALAWQMGIENDLLNETVRCTEPRNWIEQLVLPLRN